MSEYTKNLPQRLTISPTEPRWATELKDTLNRVLDWAWNAPFPRGDNTTTSVSSAGTISAYENMPWHQIAFGYKLAADVVTIYPGTIRMHGIAKYPLASEATVTLTGATEYVYAQIARGESTGTAPTIAHSTTEPETTSTHLRVPLYSFESVAAGKYKRTRILNMGDINLDTPLA